jgi:hypothetical protein
MRTLNLTARIHFAHGIYTVRATHYLGSRWDGEQPATEVYSVKGDDGIERTDAEIAALETAFTGDEISEANVEYMIEAALDDWSVFDAATVAV